jgi:hypothetical protein
VGCVGCVRPVGWALVGCVVAASCFSASARSRSWRIAFCAPDDLKANSATVPARPATSNPPTAMAAIHNAELSRIARSDG